MHTAAEALVEACCAGKDLSHRSVEEEVHSEILYAAPLEALFGHFEGLAAPELLHYLGKGVIVENLYRAQAFGQNLAVAAVAAEYEVVCGEVVRHTHSGRLLPHREVGGTGVVVLHAVVAAGGLDQVEHRLKLADGEHVAIDVLEIILGEVFLFELVIYCLVVLIDGDRCNLYFSRLSQKIGICEL